MATAAARKASERTDYRQVEIRVRGRVQGVGFRPTVWRHACALGLIGEVLNDAEGVLIRAGGRAAAIEAFVERIAREPPPLARVEAVETAPHRGELAADGFRIAETVPGAPRTQVTPDAAICPACAAEIADPSERRHRYAFTTCTHCGPRLSIIQGVPYDRPQTTMAAFPLCEACRAEYRDPTDRRFHAEAVACRTCGPRLWLERLDGGELAYPHEDPIAAGAALIGAGEILAVKGLGGYQLACDATNPEAVGRLRRLKRRDGKPFALMARNLDVIRRHAAVAPMEEAELTSPRAPIVLLAGGGPRRLPDAIAPGLDTLGFMLPTTPLHQLLLEQLDRPWVMTSGNLSGEPQLIDDSEAREGLAAVATHALVHDRPIANRVDDSVVRLMGGQVRALRRARGFAPAPIRLPEGFEAAPAILAFGGELKATFCLLKDGGAILSQHQGDLEEARTFDDYRRNLDLYSALFDHAPRALAADRHPEYLSSKLARARSRAEGLPLVEVQHHHAHLAACLAETGYPLDGAPVLGIVLDGLGFGEEGAIWGGEFLLADYRAATRLGSLKPVPMPGGEQAVREPWRNLYAHILAAMGWPAFQARFGGSALHAYLAGKPIRALDAMIARGVNSPPASSCGRLFDAVAAALGLSPDRQDYEGEAAARLEALANGAAAGGRGYPFGFSDSDAERGPPAILDPAPMWLALLDDLAAGTPRPTIAARFHAGLADAVCEMAQRLAGCVGAETIVLSGGCFQNKRLFEAALDRLQGSGFWVRTHAEVPPNDGGLALGQAAVAAARLLQVPDRQGAA